ncbi:MAG: hypothetical protein ACOY3P_22670 [Planctomycetota bacterium]
MPCLGRKAFKGKSGKVYRFKVYPWGTRFRKLSGVYIIGIRAHATNGTPALVPLYIGQTEDFSQPFGEHRKAQELVDQGANCICLQSDTVEESRIAKGNDLIAGLSPVCND